MIALELRIPPVAVVLLTAALMWLISLKSPAVFSTPFNGVLAGGLVIAGLSISLRGVIEFRRARTTVNPTTPGASSALVQSGIYSRTRNPMYLGFFLCLVGWAVWLARPAALLLLPAFVLYLNRFQIQPEERALDRLFGETFRTYSASVRRWI